MSVSIVQAKDGFQFLRVDGWFSKIQSHMILIMKLYTVQFMGISTYVLT